MPKNLFDKLSKDDLNKKDVKETKNNYNVDTSDLEKELSILKNSKKQKMEETHTRATFLVDDDTLKQFNNICEVEGRGFKTKAINLAIKSFIKDYNNN